MRTLITSLVLLSSVGCAAELGDVPGPLVLNEFMASNVSTLEDPSGGTPDWIEIHNPSEQRVVLDGWYLSDDGRVPGKSPLHPTLAIDPGAYLIFFAAGSPTSAPQYVPFRLSSQGEDVVLAFDTGDGAVIVDGYTFGAQEPDVSMARQPDGDGDWASTDVPTPGLSND